MNMINVAYRYGEMSLNIEIDNRGAFYFAFGVIKKYAA